MWQAILNFFGFGTIEVTEEKLPEVKTVPPMPKCKQAKAKPFPKAPSQAMKYNRNNVRSKDYYRRNGEYYMREDNSLILDMSLIMVLMDMLDMDEDYEHTMAEEVFAEPVTTDDAIEVEFEEIAETTSVDEIDAAVEEVAASIISDPTPPEPIVESKPAYSGGSEYTGSSSTYSGGSSYSGGSDSSSSYDSGSSDSGGGSDD